MSIEEEEENDEVYDEPETDYSDEASSDIEFPSQTHNDLDEPNFDEPLHDNQVNVTNDQGYHEGNHRPERSPSQSSAGDAISDTGAEVGNQKYQWPKIYKLLTELQHPVPERQGGAIKWKLGSFYVRFPNVCRLRLAENMGVLYLDKLKINDAGIMESKKFYKSRVLCVVPDKFLDVSVTDIVLVWPQGSDVASEPGQSKDHETISVVLFPSGRSTVPVLINTGVQSSTLLKFCASNA